MHVTQREREEPEASPAAVVSDTPAAKKLKVSGKTKSGGDRGRNNPACGIAGLYCRCCCCCCVVGYILLYIAVCMYDSCRRDHMANTNYIITKRSYVCM